MTAMLVAVAALMSGFVTDSPVSAADTSTSDGATVTTGFVTVDGVTYYYYEDGTKATGFAQINGNTYYFKKKSGAMVTGLKKIKKKYYYFAADGVMQTSWQTVDGNTYYFTKSGSDKGQAVTGLQKIKKKYYYFSKKGVMHTGWKTINKKTYYFIKKGDEKGQAATGITKISGKVYYFNKKGVLDEDKTSSLDDMDKKAANKESDTEYLILVSKSSHTVAVYKGSSKHWKRIKTYKCTIGASDTPTVTGTFKMGMDSDKYYKAYYFDSEGVARCFYATRITGGTLFHSTLYNLDGTSVQTASVRNATLGANLSHGCVRLYWKNAKWIYDHIPKGTTCIIY